MLLSAEGFFRVGVQFALLTYLVLFLRSLNVDLVVASLLFAIAHASGAAGRIIWGIVSDRVFCSKRKNVYMVIGLIAMISFIGFGQLGPSTPFWAVLLNVGLLGFTAIGFQGVELTLIAECAGPRLTGTVTGFCQSLFFIGAALIAPLVGFIVDTTNSFSFAWGVLASLSLLCCTILFFVNEKMGTV